MAGSRGLYHPVQMRQKRRPRAPQEAGAPGPGVRASEDGGKVPGGRVTVVTPTTDKRQDLHEQLFAVFDAQDWEDKELIVIETHRSKPSPFLKKKAKHDERVILHSVEIGPHDEDLSIGLKRNMGIHLSSGDWIASFDDDDLYAPSYLSTMLDAMVKQNASAITLGSWYIFEERSGMFGYVDCRGLSGTFVDAHGRTKPLHHDGWLYGFGFSYIFSQDAASDYPFPDKNMGEDFDFFMRLKSRFQTALLYDDLGICVHTLHPRSTSCVQAGQEVHREEVDDLDVAQLGELLQHYLAKFPRSGSSANIGAEKRRTERPLTVHLSPFSLQVPLSRQIRATAGEARESLARAVGLEARSLKLFDSAECQGKGLPDAQRLGVRVRELWASHAGGLIVDGVPAMGVRVYSAGFDDGNVAEFQLGEEQLAYKASRGLNIAVLDPVSRRTVFQCYDLWGAALEENRRLASDLGAVPPGHVVLVAVKDTGIERIHKEGVQALRSVGSSLVGSMGAGFREGYALIGRKGGRAVAESRGKPALAVGIVRAGLEADERAFVDCTDAAAPEISVRVHVPMHARLSDVREALLRQHCGAAPPDRHRAVRLAERLGSGALLGVDPNEALGDRRTVLVVALGEVLAAARR